MTKFRNTSSLSRVPVDPADSYANSVSNSGGKSSNLGKPGHLRDLPLTTVGVSDDDLLSSQEMAADLHCSKSYLDKLRCYGGGPPYIRLGPRKIVYRRGDGRGWAMARRFNSTSEYGE